MGVACGLFHAWFIICIEWKFLAVVAEWVFAPYLGLEGEVPGGPLACYACTPSSCKRSAGESRSGGAHHGQVVGGIGMNGKVMAWCASPLAPLPSPCSPPSRIVGQRKVSGGRSRAAAVTPLRRAGSWPSSSTSARPSAGCTPARPERCSHSDLPQLYILYG